MTHGILIIIRICIILCLMCRANVAGRTMAVAVAAVNIR